VTVRDKVAGLKSIRARRIASATFSITLAALLGITAAAPAFAATAERNVYYSYDLAGRQTDARFDSATGADELHNVYDGFGEVTSSTLTMGTFSKTLTSSYDAGGRRTQLVHPDNSYTFSYCYDALSRLTSVGQGTTCTTTPLQGFTYTSAGLPNVRSEGSTGASNVTYGWDDVGRLISQADVFGSSVATKNVNWAFTLNPASEIGQEARTIPNSTSDPYAYGGLLAVNRNYAVNGLNQYTTAGAAAFTYDANGNLTSDGTNTYTYDVENRLVSGTYTSGASTYVTSLTYDPLGRLFEVAQTRNNSTQSDTQFLYDGDALVVEYDNTKAGAPVSNRYVHGSNAAADDPLIWYSGNNLNTLRYLHADHLGSIVAIASSTGTSYATDTYDEYGINGSGNNTAERFGYTGQAWIPELGMYYYKARIYSPTLGRFLQTDPIGYKDQINLYEYVGDDPVDENDSSGEGILEIGFAIYDVAQTVSDVRSGASFGEVAVDVGNVALDVQPLPGLSEAAHAVEGVRAVERGAEAVRVAGDGAHAARASEHASTLPKSPIGRGAVPPSERDPKRVWTRRENDAQLQRQGGQCGNGCGRQLSPGQGEGHHIERHADGGRTAHENHAVVCPDCHREIHRPGENG
jgi:RHS repeat-associated protein